MNTIEKIFEATNRDPDDRYSILLGNSVHLVFSSQPDVIFSLEPDDTISTMPYPIATELVE